LKGGHKLILKLENVSKSYINRIAGRQIQAFHGLSLEIGEGDICSVKGKNGSGKTTLLRIASGVSRPSTGRTKLSLNWEKPFPSPRVGFCPDTPRLYRNVSVGEFLFLIHNILELKDKKSLLNELLDKFNLTELINEKICNLSKGTQHKVALIASVMDFPQLLVLDEPFSSLDSESNAVVLDILKKISSIGSGILVADPNGLSDQLCNKTLILD
jgi:ABC-2 type transport system ATP-binding protein